MTETIKFERPKTGKTYERVDGVWHLNGNKIPESGRGNRAVQWQIEEEYQACLKNAPKPAEELKALLDKAGIAPDQYSETPDQPSEKEIRDGYEVFVDTIKVEEARALLMAEFADDEITEGHYTTAFDGYLEEQLDRFGLSAGQAYDTAAEIVADFHGYMKWGYK